MVEKLLLNVEHIFVTYSFKLQVKIIGEFGCTLGIVGKLSVSGIS
jgi:hypothetical protein